MSDTILHRKNRFTWSLLAFQGGFVNMGGLLSIHIFVSHVTGFSARLSKDFVDQNYLRSLYFLFVPIFFLAGSFLSSVLTQVRNNQKEQKAKKSPVYIQVLAFLSMIFLAIALLGDNNHFGEFGAPFEEVENFALLCILSFACGTQNAIFTHYSKSIIRTTHLTGLTTDLGIGLAKYFISKDRREGKINAIRINLIFSFIIGSIIGAYVFPKLHFIGFIIPSMISLGVGLRLYSTRRRLI